MLSRRRLPLSRLDFQATGRRSPWLGLLLCALAAAVLLDQIARWQLAAEQGRALQTEAARLAALQQRLARQQAAAQPAPRDPRLLAAQAKQALALSPVLVALESHWQPRLALLKLDLSLEGNQLALSLEARSLDDVLALLAALGSDARFVQPKLLSYASKQDASVSLKPIQATLEMRWEAAP